MLENVANYTVIPYVAKAAEEDAVELKTDPGVGNVVTLRVEADRESAGDAVIKLQGSEDGVTYADIDTVTVKPGGTAPVSASCPKFFKITTQGDGNGRLVLSMSLPTQHVSQLI